MNRSLKLKLKILVQDHDSRSQLNLNNLIKKLNKINQIPPLAHLSGDFFLLFHMFSSAKVYERHVQKERKHEKKKTRELHMFGCRMHMAFFT